MTRPGLLAGKRAVVVGVGDGVGRETALAFAREEAELLLVARTPERTGAIAAQLRADGTTVHTAVADITDVDGCAGVARLAAEVWGGVDVVVMVPAGGGGTRFEDEDAALSGWRQGYEVTVFGTMQMAKALLPLMTSSGDARLIFVNTMAAERSVAGLIGYNSPKAALQAITRTLAVELGPHGIRVNGVHPGTIDSEGIWAYFRQRAEQEGKTAEEVYDDELGTTVLGFLPDSADIAGTILYLASPLARAVTGQAIHVNAGQWPTIDHPPSVQPGRRAKARRDSFRLDG